MGMRSSAEKLKRQEVRRLNRENRIEHNDKASLSVSKADPFLREIDSYRHKYKKPFKTLSLSEQIVKLCDYIEDDADRFRQLEYYCSRNPQFLKKLAHCSYKDFRRKFITSDLPALVPDQLICRIIKKHTNEMLQYAEHKAKKTYTNPSVLTAGSSTIPMEIIIAIYYQQVSYIFTQGDYDIHSIIEALNEIISSKSERKKKFYINLRNIIQHNLPALSTSLSQVQPEAQMRTHGEASLTHEAAGCVENPLFTNQPMPVASTNSSGFFTKRTDNPLQNFIIDINLRLAEHGDISSLGLSNMDYTQLSTAEKIKVLALFKDDDTFKTSLKKTQLLFNLAFTSKEDFLHIIKLRLGVNFTNIEIAFFLNYYKLEFFHAAYANIKTPDFESNYSISDRYDKTYINYLKKVIQHCDLVFIDFIMSPDDAVQISLNEIPALKSYKIRRNTSLIERCRTDDEAYVNYLNKQNEGFNLLDSENKLKCLILLDKKNTLLNTDNKSLHVALLEVHLRKHPDFLSALALNNFSCFKLVIKHNRFAKLLSCEQIAKGLVQFIKPLILDFTGGNSTENLKNSDYYLYIDQFLSTTPYAIKNLLLWAPSAKILLKLEPFEIYFKAMNISSKPITDVRLFEADRALGQERRAQFRYNMS